MIQVPESGGEYTNEQNSFLVIHFICNFGYELWNNLFFFSSIVHPI